MDGTRTHERPRRRKLLGVGEESSSLINHHNRIHHLSIIIIIFCRLPNFVSSPAPLNCGDAACLTSCHRAFVSNSCHFSERPQITFGGAVAIHPDLLVTVGRFVTVTASIASLFSSLYGAASDETRCRTGSLTNNANQCRRALARSPTQRPLKEKA